MFYFKSINQAEKVFDQMQSLAQTKDVIYLITNNVGDSSKLMEDFKILLARFKLKQKGHILNVLNDSNEIEMTLIFRTKKGIKDSRWINESNSLRLCGD